MSSRAFVLGLILLAPALAQANEILGFRIGSTVEEAQVAARQIKSELQDITLGKFPDFSMFAVTPFGPQIWFCNGKLISIRLEMSGSVHEFVHEFDKNRRAYGEPRSRPSQTYLGGMQLSGLHLEWLKPDGVMATLSMVTLGSEKLKTSSGFLQPNTCD